MSTEELEQEQELHEAFFNEWCDIIDVNTDENAMLKEQIAAFRDNKARVIRGIARGSITFNDEGMLVYTPTRSENKEPLTFSERTGHSVGVVQRASKQGEAHAAYALAASLTGTTPDRIKALVGVDIKVVEAVSTLLMD